MSSSLPCFVGGRGPFTGPLVWVCIGLLMQPLSSAVAGDFAACAAIASDQARLACYDKAAGRAPAVLPEPPRNARL